MKVLLIGGPMDGQFIKFTQEHPPPMIIVPDTKVSEEARYSENPRVWGEPIPVHKYEYCSIKFPGTVTSLLFYIHRGLQ